jgi:hypothetical protein
VVCCIFNVIGAMCGSIVSDTFYKSQVDTNDIIINSFSSTTKFNYPLNIKDSFPPNSIESVQNGNIYYTLNDYYLNVFYPAAYRISNLYLIDLQGRKMSQTPIISEGMQSIDMSSLPKGVYTIVLEADGTVYRKKVVWRG